MKVLIQRVLSASVEIENNIFAQIDQGLLLYVCFEVDDTEDEIDKAVKKISSLRIFEDENKKMNKDILQKNYSILSISQFTLSWNGQKGNRPSFENSMKPDKAEKYYSLFNQKMSGYVSSTKSGKFGADMKVNSINDGPVTFFLNF